MRRMIFAMLGLFAIVASPSDASAGTIQIAGHNVNVRFPRGYCVAKASGPEAGIVDRVASAVRPNNQLIAMFAKCDDLAPEHIAIHVQQGGFEDYGTLLLLTPNGQQPTIETSLRAEFLDKIMGAVAKFGGIPQQYFEAAEKRLQGMLPGNALNLGLIGADENALYMGLIYTTHDPSGGVDKAYIAVSGYTLVSGLKMTMTIIHRYNSKTDLRTAFEESKANLAEFVAAND